MNRNWKIGIIGQRAKPMLGMHGHHVAFNGLPGAEVAAVSDFETGRIEQVMSFTGAKRQYPDYREMLEREKLDIVVLCSRIPSEHLPQIKAAAERGIHVYCEKPMTASLHEADQIVGLSEKYQIKICMGHPARYGTAYRTMKKMIEAGEIGTALTVCGRGKNDHRGGGEDLIVLGTHILDLQTFLFGAPEYVFADVAYGGRPIVKSDRIETVEPIGPSAGDEVYAYFRFPKGIRGIFESRRGLLDKNMEAIHMGVTVAGTKGALSMRFQDGRIPDAKLRISRQTCPLEDFSDYQEIPLKEDRIIPDVIPLDYSLVGRSGVCGAKWFFEANRFAAWDLICSIEEDRQPVSNASTARLAVEMIHGIYGSAISRTAVGFPLDSRSHPLVS